MSAERKKVLEMLASGKISADEAEKLLEKLAQPEESRPAGAEAGKEAPAPKGKSRYLRIEVDDLSGKKVNMRLPLAFVRSGMALAGVLPARIQQRLAERGIDIGLIAGIRDLPKDAQITEALEHLDVDVNEPDGKKVRIYCE